jgi:hypothetical protein
MLEVHSVKLSPRLLEQLSELPRLERIVVVDSRTLTNDVIGAIHAALPHVVVEAAPGCRSFRDNGK